MTPEVRDRIEQIRHGNVPEGYLINKDGIHPADWITKKMGQWLKLAERPIVLEDDETYQLVTIRRGFGGVDSRGYFLGKNVLVKNYFSVNSGDFIISKRQIAHGACGVVPKELNGAAVSNEYNVFIPQEGTNIYMFNLMMQLPHYKRLFYLMSDGVHIEKLLFKTQDWMRRTLAMPPLNEQKKIAAILTTQDKVVELKEKRLAEKQRQKKYLMQQLLTGKKRLPGFHGEWKFGKLGNACAIQRGGSPRPIESYITEGEGINWIKIGDTSVDSKYITSTKERIIEAGVLKSRCVYTGDFLLSNSMSYGRPYILQVDGCIHDGWLVISEYEKLFDMDFLYYLLSSEFVQRQYDSLAADSGVHNLNIDLVSNVSVILPSLTEQVAIAKILYIIDREVDLLRQDIEQERQKKKALMQLLAVVNLNWTRRG